MAAQSPITMVAFDMYGTLVQSGVSLWLDTFRDIVEVQGLPISAQDLWREWRSRDVWFRRTRTNMERPEESPPFRTYFEAWRSEFQQTFRDLGLKGDAEDAAGRCTRDQGLRNAFTDAFKVLPRLQESWRVAILSNSDHSYLLEVIERQGWSFELVVSSESARAYKPDPRIFECFCRQASVTPSETLFVGDSLYDDVHGAKQCGFRTAWLRRDDESSGMTPPSEDQEMLLPDFEVASLRELEGILLEHGGPVQAGR